MTKQTEIVMLECFKDGKKQAEEDITHYSIPELKILLELQEGMGRLWRTVRHKPFKEGV